MPDIWRKAQSPQSLFEVRIAQQKPIAQNQWSLWVKAEELQLPDFECGQFCMISFPDLLDPVTPRPFAIVDKKDGLYHFMYRVHGKFTSLLASRNVGSRLTLLGPLGKGIARQHVSKGRHMFVAVGVGFASMLPLMNSFLDSNKKTNAHLFYGVRRDLEMIRLTPLDTSICSDDGSIGEKLRLPDLLKSKKEIWNSADWIYVCGPTGMMKAVYDILPPERTLYFLEEAMGCGMGICVGCVVPVLGSQGQKKFIRSCIDGPIFVGSDLAAWRESA